MNMSLEQCLLELGLSEKEAKVYLAALELGPVNIQNLTHKSGIRRSTVYEMLKSLEKQGLVAETVRGKRRIFMASPPESLKNKLKSKEALLNDILPELRSLNNTSAIKPKITYYEGRDGLRQIYNLALEAKNKKADWVSPINSVFETVGEDFLNKYVEIKKKMGYWIRSIHIVERQESGYKYLDPKTFETTLRRVRFAPKGIDIPNAIAIWDEKVAIISSRKEGFGFIIESKDFTQTMKIFYNLLWNISAPFSGEKMDGGSADAKAMADKEEDDYWSVK